MAKKEFDPKGKTLTFEFESVEAAKEFKSWLCNAGEQYYWTSMEIAETRKEGPITGLDFDYWKGDTIPVKCGRLSERDKDE